MHEHYIQKTYRLLETFGAAIVESFDVINYIINDKFLCSKHRFIVDLAYPHFITRIDDSKKTYSYLAQRSLRFKCSVNGF